MTANGSVNCHSLVTHARYVPLRPPACTGRVLVALLPPRESPFLGSGFVFFVGNYRAICFRPRRCQYRPGRGSDRRESKLCRDCRFGFLLVRFSKMKLFFPYLLFSSYVFAQTVNDLFRVPEFVSELESLSYVACFLSMTLKKNISKYLS